MALLTGVAVVAAWRVRARVALGWFGAGALIWVAGVGAKALAALVTLPIVSSLESAWPHAAFVAFSALHSGLMTAIFEIGATLLIASYSHRLKACTAEQAVAVGIGAGGFEAIIVGIFGMFMTIAVTASDAPEIAELRSQMDATAATTPLLWLCTLVERGLATLVHAGSRTLVLLGLQTRAWQQVAYALGIMFLVDALAGGYRALGGPTQISVWWLLLAISPIALTSALVLRWCIARWPAMR